MNVPGCSEAVTDRTTGFILTRQWVETDDSQSLIILDGVSLTRSGLAGVTDIGQDLKDQAANRCPPAALFTVVNGGGFGVPTLIFPDGTSIFGPVITPAPTGEAAMRLWDLTVGWREFPHLYEMRRPKTEADKAHIEAQFKPYVEARDWMTISNPEP